MRKVRGRVILPVIGVVLLVIFIGAKMTLQSWNHAIGDTGIHISPSMSLSVVLGMLALGVVASFVFPAKDEPDEAATNPTNPN